MADGAGGPSFADAVGTLRTMFSNLSPETLAIVLEAHSGHMERSVDYLLSLSDGELSQLGRQTDQGSAAGAGAAYDGEEGLGPGVLGHGAAAGVGMVEGAPVEE
jgi:hypothetical protein|eukprot:COSAG01_NODE_9920_length_2302_cov_1.243759_1_plen_104_part_00